MRRLRSACAMCSHLRETQWVDSNTGALNYYGPIYFLAELLLKGLWGKQGHSGKRASYSTDDCVYWESAWWALHRFLALELPPGFISLWNDWVQPPHLNTEVNTERRWWWSEIPEWVCQETTRKGNGRSLLNPRWQKLFYALLFLETFIVLFAFTKQIGKLPSHLCYAVIVIIDLPPKLGFCHPCHLLNGARNYVFRYCSTWDAN